MEIQTFPNLQRFLVKGCSMVTIIIYLMIAALLVATAVMGAIESVTLLGYAIEAPSQSTITAVLQSILLIIVIATLIDMVRSYVFVGRVLVRPILIAGVTTMVRRLLVADLQFIDIVGITIVILGLTVALIYLGREDLRLTDYIRKGDKEDNKSRRSKKGSSEVESLEKDTSENKTCEND